MILESQTILAKPSSNTPKFQSNEDIAAKVNDQKQEESNTAAPGNIGSKDESSENKTEASKTGSKGETAHTALQSTAAINSTSNSSRTSLAQSLPQVPPQEAPDDTPSPTAHPSDKNLPLGTSGVQLASPEQTSTTGVSALGGTVLTPTTPPGSLTRRLSSLSADAGAGLRGLLASSSVVRGTPGSVSTEDGSVNNTRRLSRTEASLASEVTKGIISNSPSSGTGAGTLAIISEDFVVRGKPSFKQRTTDSTEATPTDTTIKDVPEPLLKKHDSEAFTLITTPFSPESERQEHQPSAAMSPAPGSSGRGVRIVKEQEITGGRRSSSYLYNDWDRTLYEKTGRPPPGEAHWSREKSSQHGRSPTRLSARSTCPHSRSSAQSTTRSPSTRRQSSRSRPVTSLSQHQPYNLVRCQRETQNQSGRRMLYRYCFIEPRLTLHGQKIPVHGARKGSIVAAAETYAGYALELLTSPSERQLYTEKTQRRKRTWKRRRRKRHSVHSKRSKREKILIKEQWHLLEEESEKLEEDKVRLQEKHQHLEQLEDWWQTEGLLILQRDELRDQEEKAINAVIEEECVRINEERARIRQEWQLLLERTMRQEQAEECIKKELDALDEKQEELARQKETDRRKIREMKTVFEIERRMMEADRKRLVRDSLTCDAFRDALEEAELGGRGSQSHEVIKEKRMCSTIREQPLLSKIDDTIFVDKSSPSMPSQPVQHPLTFTPNGTEEHHLAAHFPDPEQGSSPPPEIDLGHPASVSSEPSRPRPPRPITARGRPVRASCSTPFGDAMPVPRPLSAVRSEGAGLMATEMLEDGETIDVWRRRPTMLQRNDFSSVVLVLNEGHREGSAEPFGTRAASGVLSTSYEPAQNRKMRATSAGKQQYSRSDGYIDTFTKMAVKSERRRNSASPRCKTRKRSVPSSLEENTAPLSFDDLAEESSHTEPISSKGGAVIRTEAVPNRLPVSPNIRLSSAQASSASPAVPGVRSSNSSGREVSPRHVSFREVQMPGDAAGADAGSEDVDGDDVDDQAAGRHQTMAPVNRAIEIEVDNLGQR